MTDQSESYLLFTQHQTYMWLFIVHIYQNVVNDHVWAFCGFCFYLFVYFYWYIVDLQCCVSFRYTAKNIYICMSVCVLLIVVQLLSHVQLFYDSVDCNPPGFSVRGISQARILEYGAISFSRGSYWPRNQIPVSFIVGRSFSSEPPRKPSIYMYLSFLRFFLIIGFYKILCTVLYAIYSSRFLLIIYFIYSIVGSLIPNSWFISPSPIPLW